MFDVAGSLAPALDNAADALAAAALSTARSRTPYERSSSGSAMAAAARKAVFTEALLSAVHARLSEIKSVTR